MKNIRRRAISQSMDLFIIVAAVLAAGGVVAASISGLIGSATANSTIEVTQASLTGNVSAGTLGAFSISIKNVGTTTISCTTTTCQIQFAGTATGLGAAITGLVATAGGTWTVPTSGVAILSPGSSFTLSPGSQISLSFSSINLGTGGSGSPASGSSITVTLPNWGTAGTSVKITAQ